MKSQIKVSQNKEVVDAIRKALKANKGYCPCEIEKTEDTLCPCLKFRLIDKGECDCGLYIKTLQ